MLIMAGLQKHEAKTDMTKGKIDKSISQLDMSVTDRTFRDKISKDIKDLTKLSTTLT